MPARPPHALVVIARACEDELARLAASAPGERAALEQAVSVLSSYGGRAPFPWSSAVRGPDARGLRELRPRGGRSRWRLLYRQMDGVALVLALAPEATADPRGFRRAVTTANRRWERIHVEVDHGRR